MSPEEKAARPPLQALLPALKPALIFECVGVPGLIQQVFEGAPRDARIVVVGVCMETDRSEPMLGIMKELNVQYVLGYTPDEFAYSLRLIAEGQVDAASLVTAQRRHRRRRARRSPISPIRKRTPRSSSSRGGNLVARRRTMRQTIGENAMIALTAKDVLPQDGTSGHAGRAGSGCRRSTGPAVVAVRGDGVFDVTARFPTVSALCEEDESGRRAARRKGKRIGDLESIVANTPPDRRDRKNPGCWRRSICRC